MLPNERMDPLFYAVIEATEEAILNALLAAETMSARGATAHRLDPNALLEVMRRYGRPPPPGA
jgi:D-aminopeptidase